MLYENTPLLNTVSIHSLQETEFAHPPVLLENTEKALLQIEGQVKTPLNLSLADLFELPTTKIYAPSLICSMQRKRLAANTLYTGVLLRDLLKLAGIYTSKSIYSLPIYILATSEFNEQCLFSWHELFNTEIGEQVIVAFSKDNCSFCMKSEGVCLIATSDTYVMPRHLRFLRKVEVKCL